MSLDNLTAINARVAGALEKAGLFQNSTKPLLTVVTNGLPSRERGHHINTIYDDV